MKFCKCVIEPGKVIEVDELEWPIHPECGGFMWAASDKDVRIAELERALKNAANALRYQGERWEDIAGGIDYDADPNNGSPENADAHLGGLAYQQICKDLAEIKSVLGKGE